jgi:transcriptional regulator with XRE-family HTH domain
MSEETKRMVQRRRIEHRSAASPQRAGKDAAAPLKIAALPDANEPLSTGSSAPRTSEHKSIEAAIGAEVRSLRKKHDMTVMDLAKQSGLSIGMLSKIENGTTSPSLSTLQGLANALNVPITSFFVQFESQRDITYVEAGRGLTIERRGTKAGHRYQLLGHSLGGDVVVEPYLITLMEGAQPYPAFQHAGTEFIYMLNGELVYRHGDKSYVLRPGDSMFFDAEAPHGPEELRILPTQFLSIIVYPSKR